MAVILCVGICKLIRNIGQGAMNYEQFGETMAKDYTHNVLGG